MRKVLYLEPVGGIAGDMFLASALDLGVSQDALEQALAGLKVPGWKLSVSRAQRHEIHGTHVDVVIDEAAHTGDHAHRSLQDIRAMISGAGTLSERARGRATAVFEALGRAEAKVHGVALEEVHFHEVGAVDSIVDVCGAAAALDLLGDPEVFSAPPPMGSGVIRSAHGHIPVPSPATLELLREVPVKFEGVGELTTPTGAALVKVLCQVRPPPLLVVERVGYGVGTRQFADRPNVLRASLGRPAQQAAAAHQVAGVEQAGAVEVVEANLDDCSPQLIAHLMEVLLSRGALDVTVVPATMKKGRPGHVVSAVVPLSARPAIVEALLEESTTLGVRHHPVERSVLERAFEEVTTPFGPVRVKLGKKGQRVLNAQPEFEDCKARGAEAHVPVKQVWAAAIAAYYGKK